MKIISCPIAGKSLIVQFESGAADRLEAHATHHPDAASHGLLLGSLNGSDPKWLHIHHVQPVFGYGDTPEPAPAADPSMPLITLGYYTIRGGADHLNPVEREFLADSLPASACLAVVITGKPDRRMLAQFYLRDGKGLFGPTPDHRQILLAQEDALVEPELKTTVRPPLKIWSKIGAVAGLAVAALIMAMAWNSRPPRRLPNPTPPVVTVPQVVEQEADRHETIPLLPKPNFVLPVQSVRKIQDPPEVAIWYPEPTAAAPPGDAHHTLLVHPIINQADPH